MSFNSTKLPNGFTVLTYHMKHLQSVAINLIVKVGSRYETDSTAGISHFLEHMAFKGTKTRTAKMIAEEFDAIGGYFNAYTGREQTVYYAKVLHNNCYKALDILADIIQNSNFNKEDIDKEYHVICQEIAQMKDNPDDLAYEKFYETAYSNNPLGRSVLGVEANLRKFDSDSFRNYLDKYYHSKNMYLSVAGNIEHEQVVSFATKLFSSLVDGPTCSHLPAHYTGGSHLIKKDLEQTTYIIGYESVPYINLREFYYAQVMALILGGGISSRLFQQIRENLGLAYSVGSYNSSYSDSGVFSIYSSTSHEKLPSLVEALKKEINKITSKVTEEELERAKAQITASIYMAEEKSSYKSEEIGKNFAIFGKYFPTEEILAQIMQISCKDIENIAETIFSKKATISVISSDPAIKL